MANTNKGRKVYICVTAQPTDLDQTGYEALIWTRVKHVGSVGESGTKTNINSYDELETDVTQKSKGISNAGVLNSDDFFTLNPGYWVLYMGPYTSKSAAQAAVPTAVSKGYTDAYVRRVAE